MDRSTVIAQEVISKIDGMSIEEFEEVIRPIEGTDHFSHITSGAYSDEDMFLFHVDLYNSQLIESGSIGKIDPDDLREITTSITDRVFKITYGE